MRATYLLPIAGLLAIWAHQALAQDAAQASEQLPAERLENRYRIGIDCSPISEALQVHLNLDPGTGLLVNGIMDDSPASRAGFKRLDVIVAAGEKPIGNVMELVRAVNSAQAETLPLTVIRRGEEMQLNVTPEERDPEEIEQLRRGYRRQLRNQPWQGLGQLPPEVREQLEQFGPLDIFGNDELFGGRGFRRVLPGIVMDQPSQPLPHGFDLNIQVDRQADGPAKVQVQHDGQTWEVTEDDLDALPDDIRPMVENMLSGGNTKGWSGLLIPRDRKQLAPPAEKKGDKILDKRFDGLQLQLQELQNAIRSLQEGN